MRNQEEITPRNRRWFALAGINIAVMMFTLDASIVNIALPTFLQAFECSLKEVQWVILAYLLAVVICLLPAAKLANRIGQKRLFLGGLILFTLSSGCCGLAWNLDSLVVFRLFQGVGAACLAALMSSLVTKVFSKQELGRALGLVTTAATIGTSIGPTIGGFLIAWRGWSWIFLVNLPFGLLALGLVIFAITSDSIDCPAKGSEARGVIFVLRGNFSLWIGLFGRFCTMLFNAGFLFLAPFVLEKSLQFSVAQAGLYLVATPLVIGIGAPLVGILSDRSGPRWYNFFGIVCLLGGVFTLSTFHAEMGGSGYLWRVILLAVGLALFNAPNNTLVMASTPKRDHPTVSALLSLALMLGQVCGVWLASLLFRALSITDFGVKIIAEMTPQEVARSTGHALLFFAIPLAILLVLNGRLYFWKKAIKSVKHG